MLDTSLVSLCPFALSIATYCLVFSFQAQAFPLDGQQPSVPQYHEEGKQDPTGRQLIDTDIETDGPYGYVPRVVHGVNKIVKGILGGSPHQVFHGAFGIAPDDVAEDLIGTYNQVVGLPDPDDLDLDETTEKGSKPKGKPKPKPKPAKGTAVAATDNKATAPAAAGANAPVANNVAADALKSPEQKVNKRPLKAKEEEKDDDGDSDDDED